MYYTFVRWINELIGRGIDLTGIQFGSLTAIEPDHKGPDGTLYWKFHCSCGNDHIARGNTIKHAASRGDQELPSCGCIELSRKTKHGFRKLNDTHPAYRTYRSMMTRCYNKNCPEYKWYGAINVSVCDEWKDHPDIFVRWSIANGWGPKLHIDKDILCKELRIVPHIYSPATCQWVTAKVNVGFTTNRTNYGKHPNIRLSQTEVDEILHLYFSGEIQNQSELARKYGVDSSSISRLVRIAHKGSV